MIHAQTAGEKTIRFPAPTDVYDCYENRLVGKAVSEIRVPLPKYGTGLYFHGNLNDYLKA